MSEPTCQAQDSPLERRVSAPWVRFQFDPEEPECVRCGTSMYLRCGGEWEDREEYNLCHECALMVIHEMRSNDPSSATAADNAGGAQDR